MRLFTSRTLRQPRRPLQQPQQRHQPLRGKEKPAAVDVVVAEGDADLVVPGGRLMTNMNTMMNMIITRYATQAFLLLFSQML